MSARQLAVAAVCLAACGSGRDTVPDALDTGSANQQVMLAIGESRQLPGGLTLSLKTVSGDSRCPQDVTCVWAGSVAAGLELAGPAGDTSFTLNSGIAPRDATFGGWRVSLARVAPTRTSGQPIPPSAYRVTLELHRQ